MTIHVPLYLCDRDVLHSPALWPADVRALERMWNLPRFPVDPRPEQEPRA